MMILLNFIYAVTLGDFGNAYSGAIGLELTYAYIFSQQIMFIGSLGYLSWLLKNELPEGYEQSFSSIPLMVGLRYFLLQQMAVLMPYLSFQIGMHFLKEKQKIIIGNFNREFSDSWTKLGMNIGAGLMYFLTTAFMIDFSIRYMFINFDPNTISNIGFHVGASYSVQ